MRFSSSLTFFRDFLENRGLKLEKVAAVSRFWAKSPILGPYVFYVRPPKKI